MKSSLFKKVIAGAASLAMVSQFAFAIPASAATTYWSDNYNSYSAISDIVGDWKSINTTINAKDAKGPTISLETDSTESIGKYVKLGTGSSSTGNRTIYTSFSSDAQQVNDDKKSVVEFDLKMANGTNRVTEFMLLAAKGTPQTNTTYTGSDYILKFDQLTTTSDEIYINDNTLGDQATKSSGACTSGYTDNTWMHVKAVLNFNEKTAEVTMSSLDGTKEFYAGKLAMGSGADSLGYIVAACGRQNSGSVGFDNMVVREFDANTDVGTTYYDVKYVVNGTETKEAVAEGENVVNIPETATLGYTFLGWSVDGAVDLITTEALQALAITKSITVEAKYEQDTSYIEAIQTVEFSTFPDGGKLVSSGSTDTYNDNNIAISVKGEKGTDLIANPDSRVEDFKVEWDFVGFRTFKGGIATGDSEGTFPGIQEYCDSYGKVEIKSTTDTSANFQLKSNAFNFYGKVIVKVTYNGKTITTEKPLVALGDTTAATGVLLPKAGYVSNYDAYSDDMVGYKGTISPDNKSGTDIILGDWFAAGSASDKQLTLSKDDSGDKYLRLSKGVTAKSCFASVILPTSSNQTVFEQNIRFNTTIAEVIYKADNPVTWKSPVVYCVNFNGSKVTINGADVAAATTDTWYKLIISTDPTVNTCWAELQDMEGNSIGKSEVVATSDASEPTTPTYFMYRVGDAVTGSVDFDNVKVFNPTVDEATFSASAQDQTLSIPETAEAPASTTTLSASVKSTDGYDITSQAAWEFETEVEEGTVVITPDKVDGHTAVLTVNNGAQSGELVIKVTIAGVTKKITVNLTSSQDSVAFKEGTASISIPMDAANPASYKYSAVVQDGHGAEIAGKTVTYAMYDKNNLNEITSLKGVTFNKETATLTVTNEAVSNVVYIRATGTNSNDETISKAYKVTIHGLTFDFGVGTDADLAEGYTAITPSTDYTTARGYGIEGAVTAGGTVTDTDLVSTDYLTGSSFTFKVDVPKGKLYTVKVGYSGILATEKFDQYLTGHLRNRPADAKETDYTEANAIFTDITEATYNVACIDGVLDLNFSGDAKVAYVEIEKQADKTATSKPAWYAIGDSTVGNNGSWGHTLSNNFGTYNTDGKFNAMINVGKGSRNTTSYYIQGWLDSVLVNANPGDIVTISGMGTNGWSGSIDDYESAMRYYIEACHAVGCNVIVGSYTSHGPFAKDGAYDYRTALYRDENDDKLYYNGSRDELDEYERVVKKIADEYIKTGVVKGYVDIGAITDNALTEDAQRLDAENIANGMSKEESLASVLQTFQDGVNYYSDHNHYKAYLSNKILPEMVEQVIDIYENGTPKPEPPVIPTVGDITYADSKVTVPMTLTAEQAEKGAKVNVIVAEYTGEGGEMLGVAAKQATINAESGSVEVEYAQKDAANIVKIFVVEADTIAPCANAKVITPTATVE